MFHIKLKLFGSLIEYDINVNYFHFKIRITKLQYTIYFKDAMYYFKEV